MKDAGGSNVYDRNVFILQLSKMQKTDDPTGAGRPFEFGTDPDPRAMLDSIITRARELTAGDR